MYVEKRFFTIHQIILSMFGLWPYQHWRSRIIIAPCVLALFICSMLSFVLKLVRTEASIDSVAQYIQGAVPTGAVIIDIGYMSFYIKKVKTLLEHIKYDWKLLQPADAAIAREYAEFGRLCTIMFTTMCIPLPFLHITLVLMFSKSSHNAELNKTSARELPFAVDIPFLDEQENFVQAVLLVFVVTVITELLILEMGSLLVICVQHACGLFCIVGRRLEVGFDSWEEGTTASERNDAVVQIFRTIMYHTRTLEFTNILNSLYGPLFCVELLLATAMLSCTILQLFQAYTTKDLKAILTGVVVITVMFIAIFLMAYLGETLLNHNQNVFKRMYMSQWYLAPSSVQKMLLVIITSSTKETGFMLTTTKKLCFEFFAALIQMSVSYYMALNSLQG